MAAVRSTCHSHIIYRFPLLVAVKTLRNYTSHFNRYFVAKPDRRGPSKKRELYTVKQTKWSKQKQEEDFKEVEAERKLLWKRTGCDDPAIYFSPWSLLLVFVWFIFIISFLPLFCFRRAGRRLCAMYYLGLLSLLALPLSLFVGVWVLCLFSSVSKHFALAPTVSPLTALSSLFDYGAMAHAVALDALNTEAIKEYAY